MKAKKYFVIFLLFSIALLASGATPCAEKASLWVTRSFAVPPFIEKEVDIQERNVMEILKEHADIETAYGGGFVDAINGIFSGKVEGRNNDWFYYINGILAHVGALQYYPADGDVIWWDYHAWENAVYISAVIGAYPQPFTGEYNNRISPTVITVTDGLQDKAELFSVSMKAHGVQGVAVETFSSNKTFDYKKNHYLVIGPWAELKTNKFLKGIYDNYRKTGFFVRFSDKGIDILDINGEVGRRLSKGAVILASKIGFGQDNPIWFITGTDSEQVVLACDLVIQHPGKIRLYSAAVVAEGEVTNVPAGLR